MSYDVSTPENVNEALLLAFIKNDKTCQELLFAKKLETDTKEDSLFNTMEKLKKKENDIPLRNILPIAIDGASAMTRHYRGFIAHFKKAVPNVLTVHCVIHFQHLVAKT